MQLSRIPYSLLPIRSSFTVLSMKSPGSSLSSHAGEVLRQSREEHRAPSPQPQTHEPHVPTLPQGQFLLHIARPATTTSPGPRGRLLYLRFSAGPQSMWASQLTKCCFPTPGHEGTFLSRGSNLPSSVASPPSLWHRALCTAALSPLPSIFLGRSQLGSCPTNLLSLINSWKHKQANKQKP